MDSLNEVTIGEVSRQLRALSENFDRFRTEQSESTRFQTAQVLAAVGPIAELKVRLDRAEKDINESGRKFEHSIIELDGKIDDKHDTLDRKVENLTTQSARLSGAISLLAFIAAVVPLPWRR